MKNTIYISLVDYVEIQMFREVAEIIVKEIEGIIEAWVAEEIEVELKHLKQ